MLLLDRLGAEAMGTQQTQNNSDPLCSDDPASLFSTKRAKSEAGPLKIGIFARLVRRTR
jgi:hypothetical protein